MVSDPETLVAPYLKYFEQVDDTDLKCMLSNYCQFAQAHRDDCR
jgi:hypothetical protein